MKSSAVFNVFRLDPDSGQGPKFQRYEVPYIDGLTVLGGLLYIQHHLDGSLAFRSSCRAGICGSCAMHINGKYRLACETQVAGACNYNVTVRPLAHLEIVKDLMTDMQPFWSKYEAIKPYLIPGGPAPEKERVQSRDDRAKLTGIIDCILCACCHASCAMTGTDPEYLGPAVLTKTARFVLDSRDAAYNERLEVAGGDHGVWRCHTMYACQEVCPKSIDPTGAIAVLKRNLICPEKR
jgi:succinate dehydrogenase / fumarate reductase iron-sulfur subunit